jgi:phosphoribosylformimino-5-aminoimidazole carboxamide ribotide isomerase
MVSVMELYPAIDLREGRCVRLLRGDYDRETRYGDDPVAQARAFVDAGATWLHVVDLDAARTGRPANREAIGSICAAVDVPVQCGGGVRSLEAAAELAALGVTRVVVGTAAVEDPDLVAAIAARQPVAVGLDARGREVATRGWEHPAGADLLDLAVAFETAGVEALVVTEIDRDGTLEGPDVGQLAQVLAVTSIGVIASGGVGTLADLEALARLEVEGRRLAGAILGRALYEGTVDLAAALEVTAT